MKLTYAESDVLKSCLELLQLRLGEDRVWRNNSGAMLAEHGGRKRLIRFGKKGSADLVGIIPGLGRWIAVETKRPAVPAIGQRAGTLRKPQREFLWMVADAGGVAVCVSDVGQLAAVLDALDADPAARFDIKGNIIASADSVRTG